MQRETAAEETRVIIDCSMAMQHAWISATLEIIEAMDIPAMQKALAEYEAQ